MKLKNSLVESIMDSMYPSRDKKVPLFIGDPGIAKTRGIFGFAQKKGVKVVQFILSNTIPSEVSGIRMPDRDTKKLEVFDDSRMASLQDGDILFFDEILEAPPMLWSACLTLIQDRVMASGRPLPDVMICAASNPVAAPGLIPPSVRDRFDIIELEFDFDDWRSWFWETHGADPRKIRGRLQGDSDQYNILSPRKFTSSYLWAKTEHDAGHDMDIVQKVLTAEFDAVVAEVIMEMAAERDDEKMILDAVERLNVDVSALRDKSLNEILEELQLMDEWPEIEAALGSIEV